MGGKSREHYAYYCIFFRVLKWGGESEHVNCTFEYTVIGVLD